MLKLFCLLMISQLISNFTIFKRRESLSDVSNKANVLVFYFKIRFLISLVITLLLIVLGLDIKWKSWVLSNVLVLIINSTIDYILTYAYVKTKFAKWFPKYKALVMYLIEHIVRFIGIYISVCVVSSRSLLTFRMISGLDFTSVPRETMTFISLTFFLLGTLSAAQIIKLFLSALSLSNDNGTATANQSIGIIIGIIERSIITLFVVGEAYSGVATVIALKTLSRFKSIEEDKEFAEYYLVGNLLSLSFSVGTGLLIRYLFKL